MIEEKVPNIVVAVSVTKKTNVSRKKFFKVPFILFKTSPATLDLLPPVLKATQAAKEVCFNNSFIQTMTFDFLSFITKQA